MMTNGKMRLKESEAYISCFVKQRKRDLGFLSGVDKL